MTIDEVLKQHRERGEVLEIVREYLLNTTLVRKLIVPFELECPREKVIDKLGVSSETVKQYWDIFMGMDDNKYKRLFDYYNKLEHECQ